MSTFVSSISNLAFPDAEKVNSETFSPELIAFIQLSYPQFEKGKWLSMSEYNDLYSSFIRKNIATDMMALNANAAAVRSFDANKTISDKLLEESGQDELSFGQRLADKVASFGGSWTFILSFFGFLSIWILINVFALSTNAFDPYPFILLNLILSCIAALQAPVIMMSQNRQEEKDRERSKNDYAINLKSELEISLLHEKIDNIIIHQQEKIIIMQQTQLDLLHQLLAAKSEQ